MNIYKTSSYCFCLQLELLQTFHASGYIHAMPPLKLYHLTISNEHTAVKFLQSLKSQEEKIFLFFAKTVCFGRK